MSPSSFIYNSTCCFFQTILNTVGAVESCVTTLGGPAKENNDRLTAESCIPKSKGTATLPERAELAFGSLDTWTSQENPQSRALLLTLTHPYARVRQITPEQTQSLITQADRWRKPRGFKGQLRVYRRKFWGKCKANTEFTCGSQLCSLTTQASGCKGTHLIRNSVREMTDRWNRFLGGDSPVAGPPNWQISVLPENGWTMTAEDRRRPPRRLRPVSGPAPQTALSTDPSSPPGPVTRTHRRSPDPLVGSRMSRKQTPSRPLSVYRLWHSSAWLSALSVSEKDPSLTSPHCLLSFELHREFPPPNVKELFVLPCLSFSIPFPLSLFAVVSVPLFTPPSLSLPLSLSLFRCVN